MAEYMKAWECVGCGRIDGPRPCLGICQDRAVEFAYADDHRDALARLVAAEARAAALVGLVARYANAHPREGAWERAYRAFQAEARRILEADATGVPPRAG